ncbi:MAG TPA: hypothetical protein VGQ68_09980 [Gaiellaceae bacterium]|nr:hypothetical protein [Gaiellaceae bacterium]
MRAAAWALGVAILLSLTGCGSGEEPSARIVLEPVVLRGSAIRSRDLDLAVSIIQARLRKLGQDDWHVRHEEGRIVIDLPAGISAPDAVVTQQGQLEFFDLQADLTEASKDSSGFPRPSTSRLVARGKTVVVRCGKRERYCPGVPHQPNRTYFYLFKYDPLNAVHPIPEMTGSDVKLIRQDFDTSPGGGGGPIVLMQFTKDGGDKFHDITSTLALRGRDEAWRLGLRGADNDVANQQFAIVLDREMRSAPTVDFDENPDGIPGDNGVQISGIGSVQEAKDLALVLQTGALPVQFRVVSE